MLSSQIIQILLKLEQCVIEKIWCCVHYQLLLNHFYCSYIVDPISDFLYVKRSANGSVIVDHINCHLAPSRFRGVHRKSKWVSWTSFASRVLIRNLNRKEKKVWYSAPKIISPVKCRFISSVGKMPKSGNLQCGNFRIFLSFGF